MLRKILCILGFHDWCMKRTGNTGQLGTKQVEKYLVNDKEFYAAMTAIATLARKPADATRSALELAISQQWQPMNIAPVGQWILLRGRNSIGEPMIPIVANYHSPEGRGYGWWDAASYKNVDDLSLRGADWMLLPPNTSEGS